MSERLIIPSHEKVASVLDGSHPGIASLIRDSNPKRNCWADLIMRAQHKFNSHDVATALRRMALAGWERHIILTWCPLIPKLWDEFEKASKLQNDYSGLENMDEKLRKWTIYGTLGLVRHIFMTTRRNWMKAWAVSGENDPYFFLKIIEYLECKAEDFDAKNTG